MAQSRATTVDQFLAEAEPSRLDALARLRATCLARLPGWEERMQWGMPGYGPPGADNSVSFNSQKNHVAVYFGQEVLARYQDRLGGADLGKGCVRFAKPAAIDYDAIAEILDYVAGQAR